MTAPLETADALRAAVRARQGAAATAVTADGNASCCGASRCGASCCGASCCGDAATLGVDVNAIIATLDSDAAPAGRTHPLLVSSEPAACCPSARG